MYASSYSFLDIFLLAFYHGNCSGAMYLRFFSGIRVAQLRTDNVFLVSESYGSRYWSLYFLVKTSCIV